MNFTFDAMPKSLQSDENSVLIHKGKHVLHLFDNGNVVIQIIHTPEHACLHCLHTENLINDKVQQLAMTHQTRIFHLCAINGPFLHNQSNFAYSFKNKRDTTQSNYLEFATDFMISCNVQLHILTIYRMISEPLTHKLNFCASKWR